MSKLLLGKIDVTKIDKDRLFKGTKGTYLDIGVWINDEPDQYGQIASIQQATKKDEPKIYIGNLKEYVKPTTEQSSTVADNAQVEDEMPF